MENLIKYRLFESTEEIASVFTSIKNSPEGKDLLALVDAKIKRAGDRIQFSKPANNKIKFSNRELWKLPDGKWELVHAGFEKSVSGVFDTPIDAVKYLWINLLLNNISPSQVSAKEIKQKCGDPNFPLKGKQSTIEEVQNYLVSQSAELDTDDPIEKEKLIKSVSDLASLLGSLDASIIHLYQDLPPIGGKGDIEFSPKLITILFRFNGSGGYYKLLRIVLNEKTGIISGLKKAWKKLVENLFVQLFSTKVYNYGDYGMGENRIQKEYLDKIKVLIRSKQLDYNTTIPDMLSKVFNTPYQFKDCPSIKGTNGLIGFLNLKDYIDSPNLKLLIDRIDRLNQIVPKLAKIDVRNTNLFYQRGGILHGAKKVILTGDYLIAQSFTFMKGPITDSNFRDILYSAKKQDVIDTGLNEIKRSISILHSNFKDFLGDQLLGGLSQEKIRFYEDMEEILLDIYTKVESIPDNFNLSQLMAKGIKEEVIDGKIKNYLNMFKILTEYDPGFAELLPADEDFQMRATKLSRAAKLLERR